MLFISFVEKMYQESNFIFMPLVTTFFGALLAFTFNHWLNYLLKKQEKRTALLSLIVNVITLSDRFLGIKKYDFLSRKEECEIIRCERYLRQQNISAKYRYISLFTFSQTEQIKFDVSMYDIGFISNYDLPLYRLILVLNNTTNVLNRCIMDLNSYLSSLFPKKEFNDSEIELLCSYVSNVIQKLDECLYFSEIANILLPNLGKRRFGKFKLKKFKFMLPIEYSFFPEAEEEFLPPKNYISGWEELEKRALKIKEREVKSVRI